MKVVVVGAGPVGAVTALAIATRGLDVTLLEADERYDERPRAATTHASTLEMLRELGIADDVIRQGLVSARFQHWDHAAGRLVAEFDYGLLADETPYPYAVQCESHKLVAIAEAKLATLPNARVLRRHEVVDIVETRAAVRTVCATPGARPRSRATISSVPTGRGAWCASTWASRSTGTRFPSASSG